jgi:SpoIIAA-like
LHIRAGGRLRAGDYDAMESRLEAELTRRGGRAPLLLDLRGWRGWTPGGLIRDLRFDLRHRNSFTRIAVVGDRAWHEWLTIAAKPLFSGPMRYFEAQREAQARQWLKH